MTTTHEASIWEEVLFSDDFGIEPEADGEPDAMLDGVEVLEEAPEVYREPVPQAPSPAAMATE